MKRAAIVVVAAAATAAAAAVVVVGAACEKRAPPPPPTAAPTPPPPTPTPTTPPKCPTGLAEGGELPPLLTTDVDDGVLAVCAFHDGDVDDDDPIGLAVGGPTVVLFPKTGDAARTIYEWEINTGAFARVEGRTLVISDGFVDRVVTSTGMTERCATKTPPKEPVPKEVLAIVAAKKLKAPQGLLRHDFPAWLFEAALRGHAPAAEMLDRWISGAPPGEGVVSEVVTICKAQMARVRANGCRPFGVAVPPLSKGKPYIP